VGGRENCDATRHRQAAKSDQKDEAEKNSKKDNLDTRFARPHGEEKPSGETEGDEKCDD
jgi:hypothetical protein